MRTPTEATTDLLTCIQLEGSGAQRICAAWSHGKLQRCTALHWLRNHGRLPSRRPTNICRQLHVQPCPPALLLQATWVPHSPAYLQADLIVPVQIQNVKALLSRLGVQKVLHVTQQNVIPAYRQFTPRVNQKEHSRSLYMSMLNIFELKHSPVT